jgi:hypothetical protein
MALKAVCGSGAKFRECPLSGDEPPILSGTDRRLETLLSFFNIYFSDRLPGAMSGPSFWHASHREYAAFTPVTQRCIDIHPAVSLSLTIWGYRCLEDDGDAFENLHTTGNRPAPRSKAGAKNHSFLNARREAAF